MPPNVYKCVTCGISKRISPAGRIQWLWDDNEQEAVSFFYLRLRNKVEVWENEPDLEGEIEDQEQAVVVRRVKWAKEVRIQQLLEVLALKQGGWYKVMMADLREEVKFQGHGLLGRFAQMLKEPKSASKFVKMTDTWVGALSNYKQYIVGLKASLDSSLASGIYPVRCLRCKLLRDPTTDDGVHGQECCGKRNHFGSSDKCERLIILTCSDL